MELVDPVSIFWPRRDILDHFPALQSLQIRQASSTMNDTADILANTLNLTSIVDLKLYCPSIWSSNILAWRTAASTTLRHLRVLHLRFGRPNPGQERIKDTLDDWKPFFSALPATIEQLSVDFSLRTPSGAFFPSVVI